MTLEQRFRALNLAPAFRELPPEPLASLAASMREEAFGPGEIVIAAGEVADRVFVLCDGTLDVLQGERPVRQLDRGALLGELAFFANSARTATVRAVGPCMLLSLHFDSFRAFLLRYPGSLLTLTGRIVRTLLDTEDALAAHDREHDRAAV